MGEEEANEELANVDDWISPNWSFGEIDVDEELGNGEIISEDEFEFVDVN